MLPWTAPPTVTAVPFDFNAPRIPAVTTIGLDIAIQDPKLTSDDFVPLTDPSEFDILKPDWLAGD
jgi:hypothetical protein